MSKGNKHAINPTREQNYPEWYQQVIKAAQLAESSPVRGCMVIRPTGYAIWERVQLLLDQKFKATGHSNAYFPLLIPLSFLEKEAEHVDGFAKECAVVTHHRLAATSEGKLQPTGELEEPFVIRPTSETIIGTQYAKWIQSYRDLPLKLNQWANVMRWEMRTRLFLRTSEFLWQEGHTAHATASEAEEETRCMLDVYADFAENSLAMPVVRGEKTADERFPGAVNTYSIEAMMQDGKALQAGTSHFLGQNFAKSFDMQFTDQNEQLAYCWTTSWGVSTRLIGGLIMTHSDDDGLVLPPVIAPTQIMILPIFRNDDERAEVLAYAERLASHLREHTCYNESLRVDIDRRDHLRGGEKNWQAIKQGVPLRIEVGPRDNAANSVVLRQRTESPQHKQSLPFAEMVNSAGTLLEAMQQQLLNKAQRFKDANTHTVDNPEDFDAFFRDPTCKGFVRCYSHHPESVFERLKALQVSARSIPLEQPETAGTCIFTQTPCAQQVVYAKAY